MTAGTTVAAGPRAAWDGAALERVLHDATVGGKQFRPHLVESVHRLLGGRPSAPGVFRTEARAEGADAESTGAYALAGAVLTGDLAPAGALRAVATAPAPPGTVARLLDLDDVALRVTAAGELADASDEVVAGLGLGLPADLVAWVADGSRHLTARGAA